MKQDIDLLIRNGKVYDGTGNEPFVADVGIIAESIAFISGPGDAGLQNAKKVIDAGGLSIAPGFIDTHAHSDFTLLADNRAEGKLLQGVTTEVNGNCGLSAAPLYGEALSHREADLAELGIKERWATFREYFDILERMGIAMNFTALAGHGSIRASVMGYENRDPDDNEMQRMCALLREAVEDGAIGLSTGLIYPPGVYAKTEELIELARNIREHIYTTHMRSEGSGLIEAIEETVKIGRESGIPVHISHIKTSGRANWHRIEKAISTIERARDEGIKVTCDRYPYTAASTDLDAILPSWTYAGGVEEELRRLNDPETRSVIKGEILSQHPSDDYWNSVTIASVGSEYNQWMEGKSLDHISGKLDKRPVDFLIDILIEERLRIGAIFHSMNEDNLRRFLSLPYVMIGSDSSVRSFDGPTRKGKPHPRGFGSFPRFLGIFGRDDIGISKAVHKMTMLPANTFKLQGRGRIKEGFIADLVVFDEERVADTATFDEPFSRPEGTIHVIVNGIPAVLDCSPTGVMAGRVLRHGRQ